MNEISSTVGQLKIVNEVFLKLEWHNDDEGSSDVIVIWDKTYRKMLHQSIISSKHKGFSSSDQRAGWVKCEMWWEKCVKCNERKEKYILLVWCAVVHERLISKLRK